jgi:hypothetical protein
MPEFQARFSINSDIPQLPYVVQDVFKYLIEVINFPEAYYMVLNI